MLLHILWQRLEEMEVQNIPLEEGKKQFDVVDKGDVVILPAFGAAVDEMLILDDKKVQVVDTTCPWVAKVLLDTNERLPWHSFPSSLILYLASAFLGIFLLVISLSLKLFEGLEHCRETQDERVHFDYSW